MAECEGELFAQAWLISTAVVIAALLLIAVLARPLANWMLRREERRARATFPMQRERLEAKFFDLAQSRGKPRGLRWVRIDWLDRVTYARDRRSGLVTAFAGINIAFEAIEGGDMEDVEAVGNIREASAVFHYRNGRWSTGGRALFNLEPDQAVERLQGQFDPI